MMGGRGKLKMLNAVSVFIDYQWAMAVLILLIT